MNTPRERERERARERERDDYCLIWRYRKIVEIRN